MPSALTIDEQIECIKFQFAQLDDAMIKFHQETKLAQLSNNKRFMDIESKVAFLETMQAIEQQIKERQSIESSSSSSSLDRHDNCHCVIL